MKLRTMLFVYFFAFILIISAQIAVSYWSINEIEKDIDRSLLVQNAKDELLVAHSEFVHYILNNEQAHFKITTEKLALAKTYLKSFLSGTISADSERCVKSCIDKIDTVAPELEKIHEERVKRGNYLDRIKNLDFIVDESFVNFMITSAAVGASEADKVLQDVNAINKIRRQYSMTMNRLFTISQITSRSQLDAIVTDLGEIQSNLSENLKTLQHPGNVSAIALIEKQMHITVDLVKNYVDYVSVLKAQLSELAISFKDIDDAAKGLVDAGVQVEKDIKQDAIGYLFFMSFLTMLTAVLVTFTLLRDIYRKLGKDPGELRKIADRVVKGDYEIDDGRIKHGVYAAIVKMVSALEANINNAELHAKRAQQATREAEKSRQQALDASQAKSEFLSIVSHEFRTPMNAILGFIQLFKRENLTSNQLEQLDKITSASRLLLTIINDVLDISRIESGKLNLEIHPFSLRQNIDIPVAVITPVAAGKGIAFRVHTAANLPTYIEGDAPRINQVLVNILDNAVKFTSKGEVSLAVTCRNPRNTVEVIEDDGVVPTRDDGRIVLGFSVKDTGIGIENEKLDKIFDSFAQADGSMSRGFGGTGLGLSICKNLVVAMGGDITVASQLGQGTTFDLTLPVQVVEIPTPGDTQAFSGGSTSQPAVEALRDKRILVVEDNYINLEIVLAILDQYGIDSATAENGQQALDILQRGKVFDCVLMDVQMPVMNGLDASRRIRELGRESASRKDSLAYLERIPIIALTANAMAGDRQTCLDAGMDDYISKPVEVSVLEQCLLRWLSPAGDEAARGA